MDVIQNIPAWHSTNTILVQIPDRTGKHAFEFTLHEVDNVQLGYYLSISEQYPYTHFCMNVKPGESKKKKIVNEMGKKAKKIESGETLAKPAPKKIPAWNDKRHRFEIDGKPVTADGVVIIEDDQVEQPNIDALGLDMDTHDDDESTNCIHFKNGACEVLDAGVSVAREQSSEETARLKKYLRFMNEFFKANFDYLFENKTIQDFMIEHEEFDEVEKLCQA